MYEFNGVFTRHDCSDLQFDVAAYTVRDLRPHYEFFGIRLVPIRDQAGHDTIELATSVKRLIEAGLSDGLALSYATYGGPVEYIRAFEFVDSEVVPGSEFERTMESVDDGLEAVFEEVLTSYGFVLGRNGFFAPFVRGYWGE